MAAISQQNRFITVTTPLGPDAFLLTGFTGSEALSRLFSYQIDLLSDQHGVAAKDLIGKSVSWTVNRPNEEPRHFNGFVSRFVTGGRHLHGHRFYRAEIVPWLWFLTRTANCRIFQQKTAPDIIKSIFDEYGFTDYDFKLNRTYTERDYCVQYRETAFNFVSRLFEEEGIFYFFKHEDGKHTLVVADRVSAYQDCPESTVEFSSGSVPGSHINAWEHQYEFRPGKWAQTDYNFETPKNSLLSSAKTVVDLPDELKFEVFDYPGEYMVKADGDVLTKLRMEEEETVHDVVKGTSGCCTFTPAGKFKLDKHEIDDEAGGSYVITSIEHSATDRTFGGEESSSSYSNNFVCIPATVIFRPARTTRKPTVQGSQTAVVVGPGGEEIYTDKYSRIKVQFFWDRLGKVNEKSSCWVRVATPWAGKQWGMVHIPRMGQEVVVDFLEGDPDRPLVIGSVYNAGQMPPYSLPGNKTQSGIKSRSSLGGGAANFNEIRFEDKMGGEMVTIHAEKDQEIGVEHNESHWVGNDRTKNIDHDETTHVKHDRTETVDNNETITVHGNRTETVDKNETITVHANRTETVDKNESITVTMTRTRMVGINESVTVGAAQEITVGGLRAVTVGAVQTITVGASQSITVGGSETESYGKNHTQTVGGAQTVTVAKAGTYKIGDGRSTAVAKDDSLSVEKKLSIEAGEEILIKTGDAAISMKKDGTIVIKGKDITIDASGEINVKASKNITMKGQKIGQN